MTSIKKQLEPKKFREIEIKKSAGILDDFAIRKNIATREGTIEKVPVNNSDIANKKYVDDAVSGVSATPAGNDTEIQFNDSGAFGASSSLTWDGTELEIGGTGNLHVPSHFDYTIPTIKFGDGDTGVCELSDDTIIWLFGGVVGNTIMRAGQLSIGGVDPGTAELSVSHATAPTFTLYKMSPSITNVFKIQHASGNTQFNNYVGNVYFNNIANGYMYFNTNNTARMTIMDAGNIGIGTVSPTCKLEVNGKISGATFFAADGFNGTGTYTNFTIVGGIVTAAS